MKVSRKASHAPPEPMRDAQWYRDAIIYELRVRAFYDANGDGIGDFQGLTEKLPYLQELGVTTLWLLPFYPSPLRDDGYDIANFLDVHPDVGTLGDFKDFLREAHARGLRVVTELVLNHTSDEHPWFQRARRAKPGSVERDFYVWSDTAARYPEARIIFSDFERSNWAWDPVARSYYWHRFFSHQPDLNFDNPAVRKAMFRVVDFWLGLGVDGLRLDAVPYLYEREGTTCENLPETLAFLEELRRHVDRKFQGRMLLAEANQWPEDAVRYLEGGNKCHMAFHFPIMPRMFMALHMEDRFPITEILAQTPALNEGCQWGMFLRNHDELTLEMVTDEERDYMYEAYARDPKARINLGIRRRLAPLVDNNRRKIELLNVLLFSMPGTPILYYGDEIGMGDNVHLGDRNGVRTPLQWSSDRNAGFSRANPQRLYLPVIVDPEYHYESVNVETQIGNASSLLWWTRRLIALRKQYRVFGRGSCTFLEPGNSKVLAFLRELGDERVLVVANLSRFTQHVELDLSAFRGLVPVEAFGRTAFPIISEAPFVLTPGPHMAFWFSLERPPSEAERADARAVTPELSMTAAWPRWLDKERATLERILPGYLKYCRWFGGKGRSLKTLRVTDTVPLQPGDEDAVLLVVEVTYAEGAGECYFVPIAFVQGAEADALLEKAPQAVVAKLLAHADGDLTSGALVDAFWCTSFCRSLLPLFAKRRALRGPKAEIRPRAGAWLRKGGARALEKLEPRLLGVEQSNTSLVFGDQLILKLYRRAASGRNPDLEIGRFLTERGRFPNTPRVAGWLEYVRGREAPWALAALHEYVPGARDAWQYVTEELDRFFERVLTLGNYPDDSAFFGHVVDLMDREPPLVMKEALSTFPAAVQLLGRRTAELHLALCASHDDPDFAPEPYGSLYQRSIHQSMRNSAQQVLRQLRRGVGALPPDVQQAALEILASERAILARFDEFRKRKIRVLRTRHHGDYHLGQVLYTGRDFVIIDFEGEPTRPLADRLRKRSVLRDVAGMLRSFHYAAASTLLDELATGRLGAAESESLKAWADGWYRAVSADFLEAYLRSIEKAAIVPKERDELKVLLDVFLLEKALYEIGYELNNRPSWVHIPLRGIREILSHMASSSGA